MFVHQLRYYADALSERRNALSATSSVGREATSEHDKDWLPAFHFERPPAVPDLTQ